MKLLKWKLKYDQISNVSMDLEGIGLNINVLGHRKQWNTFNKSRQLRNF